MTSVFSLPVLAKPAGKGKVGPPAARVPSPVRPTPCPHKDFSTP